MFTEDVLFAEIQLRKNYPSLFAVGHSVGRNKRRTPGVCIWPCACCSYILIVNNLNLSLIRTKIKFFTYSIHCIIDCVSNFFANCEYLMQTPSVTPAPNLSSKQTASHIYLRFDWVFQRNEYSTEPREPACWQGKDISVDFGTH